MHDNGFINFLYIKLIVNVVFCHITEETTCNVIPKLEYHNMLERFKTNKVLSIYQGPPRSLWDKMKLRTHKPSQEKNPG